MTPRIRFIVQTFRYWSRNGHFSRVGRVTSTITGKVLNASDVGGDENLQGDITRAFDCFPSDILLNLTTDVSRAEFQRLERAMDRSENPRAPFTVTREMLDALERPDTIKVYERTYRVVARFPDTGAGQLAANEHMEANRTHGLIATCDGWHWLADVNDKGE